MSATLELSLDELEVESFAVEEEGEATPARLAISNFDTCSEPPNCNESAKTCEYGPGCGTQFPNCNEGSNIWLCV